ncbi:hypothetical protein JTB14_019964 [Gonioctena quinquepunctata]|nr:hypothetical protein JTB14_019964 [Gonioctena quinquepunctata]
MKNELINILCSAQTSRASHQSKLLVLKKYYQKVSQGEFVEELFEHLKIIFSKSSIHKRNEYIERVLDFLAQFVSLVTPANENEDDLTGASTAHPFLTRIIIETLKVF